MKTLIQVQRELQIFKLTGGLEILSGNAKERKNIEVCEHSAWKTKTGCI